VSSSCEILGVVPARGGSKGIPGKNIRPLGGYPLIAYAIAAGRSSMRIDRLIVSTDDEQIAAVARKWGAEVPFMRPAELARDDTCDLPVFLHALEWLRSNENCRPRIVVQLRATSPLRPPECVDAAIDLLLADDGADSVRGVTVAGQTPYKMWRIEERRMVPLLRAEMHEPHNMPRQELPRVHWQTGHIEVVRAETILCKNSMTGEQVLPYVIDPRYAVDLDTPHQWAIVEQMLRDPGLKRVDPGSLLSGGLARVRLVVTDFDGVMTDNSVCVRQDGTESVVCSRADGLGVVRLQASGVPVVVLSTETNPVVAARCRKLGISCQQGVESKRDGIRAIAADRGCTLSEVAYVGNDVNDLEAMDEAGLCIAVSDAHPEVLAKADMILAHSGGRGAIRELCELILEGRGEASHG
jgi:N-acylneuraminate cytidylyltransferase